MKEKPTSIRLSEEDLKRIDEIAQKEGQKRSAILKKAVTQYLKAAIETTKEETRVPPQRLIELENKVSNISTRVSILTTQVDKILNRLGARR